jgi:hypothetical protein
MLYGNEGILTPSWLNTIYDGTGHQHDGGISDGHASKINLNSQVDGTCYVNSTINFNDQIGYAALSLNLSDFTVSVGTVLSYYQQIGNVVNLYLNNFDGISASKTLSLSPTGIPSNMLPTHPTWILASSDCSGVNTNTPSAVYWDMTKFNFACMTDTTKISTTSFIYPQKGFPSQTLTWSIN